MLTNLPHISLLNIVVITLLVMAATSPLAEESASEKGLKIAREMERRDEGWINSTSDHTMILYNKQGESAVRKLRTKALEVVEDGDKSLLIFDSPPDVKDTVFLNIAHKAQDDDQWIYLPALKRVKRIASSSKGGSFMGSEFSYEDMSAPILEKYDYLHIKDENLQSRPVYVVERRPKDPYSIYSKHVAWVDQEHYIPWQVDYYDKAGNLVKTMKLRKYKQHLKKYWRAGETEMTNHQTGKRTVLASESFTFKTNAVDESDFRPDALSSMR
jgi:hypothetical protein